MTQEQYQMALTIHDELAGLNVAKKELMYGKQHKMIENEIQEEISKLNKKIESL